MFDSHRKKYGSPAELALELNGAWLVVEKCKCGEIHAYQILEKEPPTKYPRLDAAQLTDEMRVHLMTRLPLHLAQLQTKELADAK